VPRTHRCHQRRGRRIRPAVRLHLEGLESRCLLSGPGPLSADALFHETLDTALDLTSLPAVGKVSVSGVIGAGPRGAADVNWYKFELSVPTDVRLTALPGPAGGPLTAALSLYNDAPFDPFNPIDPYTPVGHRLLAQDDAGTHPGPATLDRRLGAGNYWLAVSGSGNDYFHPFLADSGLDGRTGGYTLSVATFDPGPAYDDPNVPAVLAADPAPGVVLSYSPFALRFDLNAPVSAGGVVTGNQPTDTAQLWFNTTNDFSFGPGCTATQEDLSFALVSLEQNADGNDNELQIALANPLPAGYYEAIFYPQGYSPGGGSYLLPFQITGPVGNTDPHQQPGDSVYTALDIPHAADGRLHQVGGAVGVDPTDPNGFNRDAVEFYHFTIDGAGPHAFDAEVFAGRIGSPLDPALTLYRVGALGDLEFVASNGNTGNTAVSTDRHNPLYTDAALLLSLPSGEYFLAVSSGLNFPDPLDPTRAGVFDPFTPQSATTLNANTGPYVLNLLVQPAGAAPQVVAVLPDTGPTGAGPLTGVRVRFSQPVNLLPLEFQAFQQSQAQTGNGSGALASATLTDAQGQPCALRLESYDGATNTATFILLGAVPPGAYTLRLSGAGPQGITGDAGAPLADFVTTLFSGTAANGATSRPSLAGFDGPGHAQPLGVLFPVPLSGGITITRDASAGAGATEDDYTFQVLQSRQYSLAINGPALPAGLTVSFIDSTGAVAGSYTYDPAHPPAPFLLAAGTYTLDVTWSGGVGTYALTLSIPGSPENPVPLVVGSGPALRARLLSSVPDPVAPLVAGTPAPVVAPASTGSPLPAVGLLTLPSSPLVAQAFSPLNGVAAPGGAGSDGGDRLLVRGPAPTGPSLLLGILIGTQPPLVAGGDEAAESPPPVPTAPGPTAGQSAANLDAILRAVDEFFESWGWFSLPAPAPVAPPAAPDSATPAPPTVGDGGAGDGADDPQAGRRAPDDGPAPWVLALAAGAALVPDRRRRAPAPGGRVGTVDAGLLQPR
jgi:hypothetical protein